MYRCIRQYIVMYIICITLVMTMIFTHTLIFLHVHSFSIGFITQRKTEGMS